VELERLAFIELFMQLGRQERGDLGMGVEEGWLGIGSGGEGGSCASTSAEDILYPTRDSTRATYKISARPDGMSPKFFHAVYFLFPTMSNMPGFFGS